MKVLVKININILKNSGDILLVKTKPNSLLKTSIKVKDWKIISNVRIRFYTKKKCKPIRNLHSDKNRNIRKTS